MGFRGRLSTMTEGWGWLVPLRLGLAAVMVLYAVTFEPAAGRTTPDGVPGLAVLLAAIPAGFGLAALHPRLRSSRPFAVAAVPADAFAVLATVALYASDPRRYLLALVVVVQAEAGAVLGMAWGTVAWAVISAAFLAVEGYGADSSGVPLDTAEVALRLGVGLIVTLSGGYLSGELTGERRRRQAERERSLGQLQEAEARYRSLVEQTPVVTYMESLPSGRVTYASPQIEELTGFTPEQWTSAPAVRHAALDPEQAEAIVAERGAAAARGEPLRQEYRLRRIDGTMVWVRDEATLVTDERGRAQFWQGVMVDITERKTAEEEVTFRAYHDPLTGLPNRAMFEELVEVALARADRRGSSVAVLYLDLDGFKQVNDTLGHAAGDEVLQQVGRRLQQILRGADSVARHGGDEFLVLLPDLEDPEDGTEPVPPVERAMGVAARVHEALAPSFEVDGRRFAIAASVGVSLYPAFARDARELLVQSDAAMYESKRAGSGLTLLYGSDDGRDADAGTG
jgi:diguanylate cyclase (GGDEF)-like protein/PAS domain S-box-containing protein